MFEIVINIEMASRPLSADFESDFLRHQTMALPLLRYMTLHKLVYTFWWIVDANYSSYGIVSGNRKNRKIG